METAAFIAGLGVGLSIGLGIALRLMAARDPVQRSSAPRPPRPDKGTGVALLSPREREEMTR
jgi:hypothetical protein